VYLYICIHYLISADNLLLKSMLHSFSMDLHCLKFYITGTNNGVNILFCGMYDVGILFFMYW
jgi:hypothetical protein